MNLHCQILNTGFGREKCTERITALVNILSRNTGMQFDNMVQKYGSLSTIMDDRWVAADITSFSTIFQSYQDDERLLLKGCMQMEPHLRWKKKFRLQRESNWKPLSYWYFFTVKNAVFKYAKVPNEALCKVVSHQKLQRAISWI